MRVESHHCVGLPLPEQLEFEAINRIYDLVQLCSKEETRNSLIFLIV